MNQDDFPYHLERDFSKIWNRIVSRWAGPVVKEIKAVLSQKEVRTDAIDSPPTKAAETRVKEILASMKALSLTEKELEEIKKFYFTLNRWSYATASTAIEEVRKIRTRKKKFFPSIILEEDSPAVQQFQTSYVEFNKELVRSFGREWNQTVTETMTKGFLGGLGKKELVESLMGTQKIQQSKAEFWARDQLGDAYGKFTEQRFKEAGIPGYVWMTSQDNRVRDSHALLHGKFFRFTETPPGLSKPGAKFPGEDYNCRCRQRPAIDESDALSESQQQKVIAEINRERKKFGEPKVNEE